MGRPDISAVFGRWTSRMPIWEPLASNGSCHDERPDAVLQRADMKVFLQALVNGLDLGSFYAIIALGIALIFGVMRLINFAHGELIMAGAYVFVFASGASVPIVIAALLVVVAVAVLALIMERVAFR